MKGTSSIYFFLHTDAFDVLNVGFNFHSQPSHDVFGIGLCQKSDDFCHDEVLGEDFCCESANFRWSPFSEPTKKATASKLFEGESLCPSTVWMDSENH